MSVVLDDLVKKFPASDHFAVNHISLNIEQGQLVVFLGPSGCGKTTTMRIIAGLEHPDSGRVFIGEREVTKLAPKDRRVAMVFQNFTMYPSMSVYENIAFPLRVIKQPKAEIDRQVKEAANLVGVSELLQRSVRQVSGGEAQRVALARAMVRRPDVFLMDEPLSSLDAKLRIQLRTEIKRLHQNTNSTIIFVTHDQEEAMVLGDVIVVMDHGNVQQVGTPQEVFFKPRNVFVATFVGTPTMNLFDATLRQTGDGTPCIEMEGFVQPVPRSALAAVKVRSLEQVKWGIRPEAVRLISAGEASAPGDLPGEVELIEAMGSRQLVFVRAATRLFSVIEDGLRSLKVGEPCTLHFDENNTHLFDAASGESLAQDG